MPDVSRLGRGELQGLDGRLSQQPPQPRVRVVLDEGLRVLDPNLEYNYTAGIIMQPQVLLCRRWYYYGAVNLGCPR